MPLTPRNALLGAIIAAVVAWGILHAVGAYLQRGELGGAVVILICTAVFVGGWLVALAAARRKPRRREPPPRP